MENFDALKYINSLTNFKFTASLSRVNEAMTKLNFPNKSFKAIHIAGTNGKGSVVAMVTKSLEHSGLKVGRFISPHITDFCERIQINGENISVSDLNFYGKAVKDTNIKLNTFEFITCLAFLYFAENNVNVAVIETGLGGRLDATNVLENVCAAVITKIGLDHTEILGDTVEKIAREKCGIIKGGAVITSPYQEKGVMSVINEFAKSPIVPDTKELKVISSDITGNVFLYKGVTYKTKMAGDFQTENALIAIETLKNCGIPLKEEDIKAGISEGFMEARLQIINNNPLTVVDGAHNPCGAYVLSRFLKNYKNVTAVIGVMRDKDYNEVLKTTLPFVKKVICVTPDNYGRSLKAEELALTAGKYIKDVTVCGDLKQLPEILKNEKNEIFIYGSLYLAANVLKLLK